MLEDSEVGIYHCINRCVRRAFLCGVDDASGKNYEHRKVLIRRRLEFLAGRFGVDVLGYSIMSNHLHVILRNRWDVVSSWSDEEVARRWWELFPARREENGSPAEPNESDLRMIVSSPEVLRERRRRLANLSWFMRCLCEPIARESNKEDQCTGHFWEGRFKCQRLLDEAAVLACSMYVDLNPVRAGIAKTPEESQFTSAHDRIEGMQSDLKPTTSGRTSSEDAKHRVPTKRRRDTGKTQSSPDRWLSPIELSKTTASKSPKSMPKPKGSRSGTVRASDLGFLPMKPDQYFELLDWTGRQTRKDKCGVIPKELSPILQRLGVSCETWVDTVKNFGRWFHRAAGRVESLQAEASRRNRRWMHGISHSRQAFC